MYIYFFRSHRTKGNKEGNEVRNWLMMFASCISRCLLMQLEANTPHLLDIAPIFDRISANIVCDLPFLAFPSAHPFSIPLYICPSCAWSSGQLIISGEASCEGQISKKGKFRKSILAHQLVGRFKLISMQFLGGLVIQTRSLQDPLHVFPYQVLWEIFFRSTDDDIWYGRRPRTKAEWECENH